jgi:hypothetical protein
MMARMWERKTRRAPMARKRGVSGRKSAFPAIAGLR